MKPLITRPFHRKTTSQRYQLQWSEPIQNNLRLATIICAQQAFRVAISTTILIAPAFISAVSAASFSASATFPVSLPQRIAATEGSASALNNHGLVLMKQGDYASAQALFNQALRINPRFAPAYSNRAMIHILMGEETAAIQDYSLSLSLNPNDGDVYYNRGLAYATVDNNSAAIADYTKALQINPHNAQAYHARGGVYLSLNNRAMARSDFQAAVTLYRQQGYQEECSELQTFLSQF
jgi:tetratricopeptide (TPR) repeat protein